MTLSNGSVISTLMEEEVEEEGDEQQHQVRMEDRQSYGITFPDFPGGPGTFEAAAKFCYGFRVELTAWNVAPLRCVAEYLEMTEEHAEDNLAARAEAYLGQTVLRHPGKATKALKSCEELLPHAEELGIVGHCVEAIVTRSSAASRSWFDDLAVLGLHMYKWVGGGGRGSGGVGCAGGREGPAGGGAVWVKEWAMFLDVCVDRAGMDVDFRPAAKLPGQL